MTRFYSIDTANDALREVEPILRALRDERAELIRLRDRALAGSGAGSGTGGGPGREPAGEDEAVDAPPELAGDVVKLLRLRMQGLIDQMTAGVSRLTALDVTLRDIESGLIDFPALVAGRQVWLCWRLGEGAIEWWHELETGIAGRHRLIDLS